MASISCGEKHQIDHISIKTSRLYIQKLLTCMELLLKNSAGRIQNIFSAPFDLKSNCWKFPLRFWKVKIFVNYLSVKMKWITKKGQTVMSLITQKQQSCQCLWSHQSPSNGFQFSRFYGSNLPLHIMQHLPSLSYTNLIHSSWKRLSNTWTHRKPCVFCLSSSWSHSFSKMINLNREILLSRGLF